MVFKDSLNRNRLAEVESLQLGASDLLKEMGLLFCLNALADRIHSQSRGHLHQLGQYDPSVFALVKLSHEAHVEFDQIELYALKNIQGRVSASEVIHPHREAEIPEPFNLLLHEFKVAADNALCDLNGDHSPVHACFVNTSADLFNDVAGIKVGTREVDGMRNYIKTGCFFFLHMIQDLFQHIQVKLVYQACVLQIRDEIRRRQEALDRVDPSRQSLFIADFTVDRSHDRLIVDLYPVL